VTDQEAAVEMVKEEVQLLLQRERDRIAVFLCMGEVMFHPDSASNRALAKAVKQSIKALAELVASGEYIEYMARKGVQQ